MENIVKLLSVLNDNLGIILVFLVTVTGIIERSQKIAARPLSALFKWIGKIINKDLETKTDLLNQNMISMQEQIKTMDDKIEADRKKELKILIADFANDLKQGINKSEAQFIAIRELTKEYLDNGWNTQIQLDAIYIEEEYKKRYY